MRFTILIVCGALAIGTADALESRQGHTLKLPLIKQTPSEVAKRSLRKQSFGSITDLNYERNLLYVVELK